jgi:hypothetical protein
MKPHMLHGIKRIAATLRYNSLVELSGHSLLENELASSICQTVRVGREISAEAIEVMQRVFDEEAVAVPWRHGDVMLLDNMQVMHSRQTFVGPRRQGLMPVPFIKYQLLREMLSHV